MKDLLNNLNLTNDTIEIFLECMGKIPLTYEEIHSIKSHLSDNEFKIIFDELIKNKLLVNVVPVGSKILNHYLAIPPFNTILNKLISDKDEDGSDEIDLKSNIKKTIIEVFNKKDNPIEILSILNELKMMKQNFNNDSSDLRKEIHNTLDSMQNRDDSTLFYLNFEDNVKKSINSQFASILEIILQIDIQSDEIPGIKNLSEEQWNNIRQDLKNYLAKSVHEKAQELDKNISDNFREIKDYFGSKLAISMEEEIGQRAVDLGILKIVIEELSGLYEFIDSKNQTFTESWEKLANLIENKLSSKYKDMIKDNLSQVKVIENLLPEILETYFKIDNTWRITSIPKISEEISNIMQQSAEDIIILIPNIKDFIPLDTLKNSSNIHAITIIASDSHESELIGEINSYPNVNYLRIEKNKAIGIIGAGILIIGYYELNPKDLYKKINAVGTLDESLIELFSPIITDKVKLAKPPARVQMNNNFNTISKNINVIEGKEISLILQENLDIATNLKGISLNVLELKLLISKLKMIQTPLSDNDLKGSIIEKINSWNEEFTSLPLDAAPDLKIVEPKDLLLEETKTIDNQFISPNSPNNIFDESDPEKIEPLFDILFEKIENTKGEELSNIIQDVINTLVQIQGYSIITTWKDELASEEFKTKLLEKDFKNKFIDDFTLWKNEILKLVDHDQIPSKDYQTLITEQKDKLDKPVIEEIDLAGYVSPGMTQEQNSDQIEHVEASEENEGNRLDDKIISAYDGISQNVNAYRGIDISNKLQILGDLLVEKHGYMATKDIRPWLARLKKHKNTLEDDIKNEFNEFFYKIKDLYVGETKDDTLSDYVPSFANIDSTASESQSELSEENKILTLFNKVLEDSNTLNGYELTADLQEIADIIMQTKGALSARSIRPWISKLRAIREPLEEDVKIEFAQFVKEMKEKFC